MKTTLVLPDEVTNDLLKAAQHPLETAGVLLATVFRTSGGDIRLLAREIIWVTADAYLVRKKDRLTIASEGYVHALSKAESTGTCAIWLHTHPGQELQPVASALDEIVETQISDVFRLRSGTPYFGTLIISPTANDFSFTGFIQEDGQAERRIDRAWCVGNRLRLAASYDSAESKHPSYLDRNIRAFGAAVQHTLSDLHVAVVGCGGTGSIIAEQLVRLGVRNFTLVDPDTVSLSNVTRLYGSMASSIGAPKVNVVAEHLAQIAPEVSIRSIAHAVTDQHTARLVAECDVVFGATDDNAGRLVLSRLPTYFLLPVIDCGVLLSSDADSRLTGIDGRVTTLLPGQACLVCRNRIDLARAAAELLLPEEQRKREREGYAPALGRIEPAVVTFTTMVGATSVGELLERLIGFGPEPRPNEVLIRFHEREISTNLAVPRVGHYCHQASGKMAVGATEPFLEQAWST